MKPVVTLGETMGLFRAVSPGPLSVVSEFELGVGGAESNVAIGLARLGTPSGWIGRVGDDPIGVRVAAHLRAEGVATLAIVDNCAPTGVMLKEQSTSEARSVLYYRTGSAGSRLCVDDLDLTRIEDAALLHVTGIAVALSPSAHDAIFAAVYAARAAGVPVSFDVNHRPPLWVGRDPAPTYRALARLADVVFAGDDEAAILIPDAKTPSELAAAIATLGPAQVVIKLGARGCVALVDGVEYAQAAVPIEPIDTVGAGDAFVAAYLAELLAGLAPADRLMTATGAGALACLHIGDWEGSATRAELAGVRPATVDAPSLPQSSRKWR